MKNVVCTIAAGLAVVFVAGTAQAAKPARKPRAAAPAPTASAEEVEKLKGAYRWGMSPDDVAKQIEGRLRASYEERLQKSANDPTRNDRVRKELQAEIEGIKRKYVKFEGQKSGYDVSIIDQEFAQKTGESMLVAKEDNATRYYFFANEGLYKMFVAFDKEILAGKSFLEFGKLMQARFGRGQEIFGQRHVKGGTERVLDHYLWTTKAGDVLRLVDRSEFYDVYCLVLYDGGVAARLEDTRRVVHPKLEKRDGLIEAVTSGDERGGAGDENDNIIDRITGTRVRKPGEE